MEAAGRTFLEIDPATLTALVREAVNDIQHLLRPAHLAQLRAIVDDPEARQRPVRRHRPAAQRLRLRGRRAADVPGHRHRDRHRQAHRDRVDRRRRRGGPLARHLRGLRAAQPALLADGARVVLGREQHRHQPARADRAVPVPGQAPNTSSCSWPRAAAAPTRRSSTRRPRRCSTRSGWPRSSTRSCARWAPPPARPTTWRSSSAACPPSTPSRSRSWRRRATWTPCRRAGSALGHAFRDRDLEQQVLELTREFGIGAQFGGKYFCHDVRVIRLPRHGASLPGGHRRLVLGRPPGQGQDHAGGRVPGAAGDATRRASCPRRRRTTCPSDVVEVDLNRPMDEIRAQLSSLPVKTRVSLTGPLVVARDIAHAKIAERLDAGEPMPEYLRDHPVYYAGPAKTPAGYASGSFGPTTAGRMDSYVEQFQAAGGSLVMLAKGNRSKQVTRRARPTAASTWARSAARPPGWRRTASARSRCSSTRSWAWKRSGGSRSRTSPRSSSSTTRATTSSPTSASRPCKSASDGSASAGLLTPSADTPGRGHQQKDLCEQGHRRPRRRGLRGVGQPQPALGARRRRHGQGTGGQGGARSAGSGRSSP